MINNAENFKYLYIHPIFEPLIAHFRFFFVGLNMLAMPMFQDVLIKGHNNRLSRIDLSVKFDNLTSLYFNAEDSIALFNKKVRLQIKGDKVRCYVNPLLNFQARQMAISFFDTLQNSKFNNIINRTEIFKFANHIRNGAAHNNKFTFDKPIKTAIKWRNKKIDDALKGKEVFASFITLSDLIVLIYDISQIIKDK